jgi:cobalamin-dependent methionine synthase I
VPLPLPIPLEDPAAHVRNDTRVDRCLDLIKRFDGRGLDRELSAGLAALGALTFMESQVSPLLHEVGDRWRRGELSVSHEHFASERLHEFLARQWQPLSDAATGPISVCATPAGEHHTLGLQMAAYTLSLNNLRVVYLGANLPAADLASAIAHHAARVTLLSAALGADTERLYAECAKVRAAVGPEVTILTGGAGFQPAPDGTTGMTSLRALSDWARSFSLNYSPN